MIALLNSGNKAELRAFLKLYTRPVYERALAITKNEEDAIRVTRRVTSEVSVLALRGKLEEDIDAQLMALTDACCSEDMFFARLVEDTLRDYPDDKNEQPTLFGKAVKPNWPAKQPSVVERGSAAITVSVPKAKAESEPVAAAASAYTAPTAESSAPRLFDEDLSMDWEDEEDIEPEDEADPASQNDFGKNVIPAMLKAGERLAAYRFEGYWKDVGTVESLWEANMDLLDEHPALDLYDQSWKIYSKNPVMPPHMVEKGAVIKDSMVTEGCDVAGTVLKSVLFAGVRAEKGSVIEDSIVMPGAVIKPGARICRAVIGEGAIIGENASVGEHGGKIALIGPFAKVSENAAVPGGAVFGKEEEK